jgi:CheY-like chemotaxis protein
VRVIRSDPALSDTPILVMTAFSDIEAGEATAAGANRFLAKPFDLHELTAAVKDLL